jgi:general secretion pathway protein B
VSYILEALKKLEQKRQREESPNILSLHGDITQVHKKRLLWPYIAAGLLFLNGIIVLFLFWIGPWKNAAQPPPQKPQIIARESTAPPPSSALPEKKDELPADAKKDVPPPEKKDVTQPAPSQPSSPVTQKVTAQPAPPKTASAQPPLPAKTPDELTPKTTKPLPSSSRIVSIKELPADVKSKLPELKMTVHSYNEQSQSRFVVINNNTVREGQFVNGELKLEKITQNGVILYYQGHRFTLGINESP